MDIDDIVTIIDAFTILKWIALFVTAGVVGSIIARRKGRRAALWFILCMAVPLLVAVIVALPSLVARGYTKKCPYCAEIIKEDAKFCRYCGKEQAVDMVKMSSER